MPVMTHGRLLARLAGLVAALVALAAAPSAAQMPGEAQAPGGAEMPGGAPGGAQMPADSSVVSTPPQGSPERAAILGGLRPMVIAEVGGPVEFVVGTIRVVGEWAFVEAKPQRPGGGPIFYIYTRYQGAWDAGAFDDSVTALLRQTPAGWLVYEYNLGATDVQWMEWVGRNLAPAEVYPFQ